MGASRSRVEVCGRHKDTPQGRKVPLRNSTVVSATARPLIDLAGVREARARQPRLLDYLFGSLVGVGASRVCAPRGRGPGRVVDTRTRPRGVGLHSTTTRLSRRKTASTTRLIIWLSRVRWCVARLGASRSRVGACGRHKDTPQGRRSPLDHYSTQQVFERHAQDGLDHSTNYLVLSWALVGRAFGRLEVEGRGVWSAQGHAPGA